LCIASVADQEVDHEHIIQDAGSWSTSWSATEAIHNFSHPELRKLGVTIEKVFRSMLALPGNRFETAKAAGLSTPLAAAGLTTIMIGATTLTIIAMGAVPAAFPAIVGVVTVWIAYARTSVVPIAEIPRRVLRTA